MFTRFLFPGIYKEIQQFKQEVIEELVLMAQRQQKHSEIIDDFNSYKRTYEDTWVSRREEVKEWRNTQAQIISLLTKREHIDKSLKDLTRALEDVKNGYKEIQELDAKNSTDESN